ncbi:hypothetical protein IEO21_03071 [Rhodonia placenta]|uniref:BHLH domain-containing protein n=1 Tax=Rhodonia placenta TaxID=104341 RepID=A0A8H7U4K5_9APHY|nr:hypothetical protein IEO21_03071 [Postia placenta]
MAHPDDHPPSFAFDDVQFFNPPPFLSNDLFPPPPPLPPSADLFSPSEATDFFGFLENFSWEFDVDPSVTYLDALQVQAPSQQPATSLADGVGEHQSMGQRQIDPTTSVSRNKAPSVSPSESSSSVQTLVPPNASSATAIARPKPLLSGNQKRVNHILSEQKRRNAIRDGYMQLTTLLAPAGAPPGTGMPTRGRPKGSGGRGRGSKGKSGILFKAREYIRFLEEGRDALVQEVVKVEGAAGIRHP